jgi:hypothetical protein
VASGALFHARLHRADRIFCGHTHAAMQEERDGIHYYNAGGWVDEAPTYITIGEESVQIHEYPGEDNEPDPGEEQAGEGDSEFLEFTGDAEHNEHEDEEYENVR